MYYILNIIYYVLYIIYYILYLIYYILYIISSIVCEALTVLHYAALFFGAPTKLLRTLVADPKGHQVRKC